uniref:Uncharacterized protein n=1 Tax=Arundo donax TaxID=35708 RepID=A0A0A8Z754_ARUDO
MSELNTFTLKARSSSLPNQHHESREGPIPGLQLL